jgi:SPX domain protein involved in polyphosphate accumulation
MSVAKKGNTSEAAAASPLFFERYELKYQIPYRLVDPISKFVSAYCDMDYYSQISSDGFYRINSLYLDSPQLSFFENKENLLPHRMNMRIRSYGDQPEKPYYFECKEKKFDFVKKRRAKVMTDSIQSVIEGTNSPDEVDQGSLKNLNHFLNIVSLYNAVPQVLTQYRRRAFLSNCEDYVRVTFDIDMKCKSESEYNIWPNQRDMYNYDVADIFDSDYESLAVLELKCESRLPMWFLDLIRLFELERGSFSKYGNSLVRSKKLFL